MLKKVSRLLADAQAKRSAGGPALLAVAAALVGAAHILVRASSRGAEVSVHSMLHIADAVTIAQGGAGDPQQPPLYALMMAFGSLFGVGVTTAATVINGVAFGLTILVSGLWLGRNIRSRPLAIAALVAAVVSPVGGVASYILSESVLVLFVALALVQLDSFLGRFKAGDPSEEDEPSLRPLALAGVYAALATLTGFAGVVLVLAGLLSLFSRRHLRRARFRYTAVFGALSLLPLAALLLHNLAFLGSLAGDRPQPMGQSVAQTLGQMSTMASDWLGLGSKTLLGLLAALLSDWIYPAEISAWLAALRWPAIGAMASGMAGCLVWLFIRPRKKSSGMSAACSGPGLPFGFFASAYLLYVIVAASYGTGPVEPRHLAPVAMPVLLLAALFLDRLLDVQAAGWLAPFRRALLFFVTTILSVHIGFSVWTNIDRTIVTLRLVDPEMYDPYGGAYPTGPELERDFRRDSPGAMVAVMNMETPSGDPYFAWRRHSYRGNAPSFDEGAYCVPRDIAITHLDGGTVFRRTWSDSPGESRQPSPDGMCRPIGRSTFDVHFTGVAVVVAKEPCTSADIENAFFVRYVPVEPDDLIEERREFGFDDRSQERLWQSSVVAGGRCLAGTFMPYYPVGRITVGQFIEDEPGMFSETWSVTFYPVLASEAP